MMQQAIKDRCGQHRIAEHFAPVQEALVGQVQNLL